MRISDWSSDVCSSDLASPPWRRRAAEGDPEPGRQDAAEEKRVLDHVPLHQPARSVQREVEPFESAIRHPARRQRDFSRSEEHTSELQSLMRISYAVFCLNKKIKYHKHRYLYSSI